jgi:hypothetical protein
LTVELWTGGLLIIEPRTIELRTIELRTIELGLLLEHLENRGQGLRRHHHVLAAPVIVFRRNSRISRPLHELRVRHTSMIDPPDGT